MRSYLLLTVACAAATILVAHIISSVVTANFTAVVHSMPQTGEPSMHIDLTHVDALTLMLLALSCIPVVQFLTESAKQALKGQNITLSPIQMQAMTAVFGVVCTEVAALVKMTVDLPTALMAMVLGVGVSFAASGHRDYLVAAYKIVLNLTHSSDPIPPTT